jgi:hypothetical protein
MEKALLAIILFVPTSLSVAFMLWVFWNLSQDGKKRTVSGAQKAQPMAFGQLEARRSAEGFRTIRMENIRWGEQLGTRFHVKTCD